MDVEITPIPLGFTTCFILRGDGVIAIDAGIPRQGRRFIRAMRKASISPESVSLIVLTHGHFDHIGAASELREATGAKIAIHEDDVPLLAAARTPFPPGVTPWGSVLSKLYTPLMPFVRFPPAAVDLPLGDDGLSLRDYGIPGRVIYTPGHTPGSVSILLETGEAFVGDLAMSKLPLRLSPGLPVLAENLDAVVRSWRLLLDAGATRIYPAHGRAFPAEIIRDAIRA